MIKADNCAIKSIHLMRDHFRRYAYDHQYICYANDEEQPNLRYRIPCRNSISIRIWYYSFEFAYHICHFDFWNVLSAQKSVFDWSQNAQKCSTSPCEYVFGFIQVLRTLVSNGGNVFFVFPCSKDRKCLLWFYYIVQGNRYLITMLIYLLLLSPAIL